MNMTFCIADVHSMSRKPCLHYRRHSSQRVSMFTGWLAKIDIDTAALPCLLFTGFCGVTLLSAAEFLPWQAVRCLCCKATCWQRYSWNTNVVWKLMLHWMEPAALPATEQRIISVRTLARLSMNAQVCAKHVVISCRIHWALTNKSGRSVCVPDRCWLWISSTMDFVQCREASLEVLFSRRVSRSWKHCTGSPEVAGVTSVIIAYVLQQNCFCRPFRVDRLS